MTVAMPVLLFFRFGFLRFTRLGLQMMVRLFRLLLVLLLRHRVTNGVQMLLLGRVKLGITGADSFAEFPQFRLSCLNGFGHTIELYLSLNF